MKAAQHVRSLFVALFLAGACAVLLFTVNKHYPIARWLVWRYLGLWLGAAAFSAACLASGNLVVRKGLRLQVRFDEHVVFSMATGVLVFGLSVLLAGLLGLLGTPLFFILPTLLIAITPRFTLRFFKQLVRYGRSLAGLRGGGLSGTSVAILLFGAAGITLVYLPVLLPENAAFDSQWYHLGNAEAWVVDGRIAKSREAWFHSSLPQFASWLYAWALLAPFDSWMRTLLAAHMEFAIFLMTLASVPVLVRWMLRGRPARWAWVAMFLFPELFLYDSSLGVAADHVLAFFAVPVVLAARGCLEPGGWRKGVLLGWFLAGALMTKYQAIYLWAGAAVILVFAIWEGRAGLRGRKPGLRRLGIFAAAAGIAGFVGSTGLWLKNLIWYRNPFYPLAHGIFGGRPWIRGSAAAFTAPQFEPSGTLGERVLAGVKTVFTFSFLPHDWPTFHREVPIFGFLFTLLLPTALLLRGSLRSLGVGTAGCIGVFVWYMTFHQDRYLQALLPWMAGFVAAVAMLAWGQVGKLGRTLLVGLVALQILWGGDVPFFPSHAMIGASPYSRVVDLLGAGFRHGYKYEPPKSRLESVGQKLPEDAVVLLHEEHLRYGLRRPIVADARGRQGRISYHDLQSPDAVYRKLSSLGVTHVLWRGQPWEAQLVSDDLVFYDFAHRLPRIDSDTHNLSVLPQEGLKLSRWKSPSVLLVTCQGVSLKSWSSMAVAWRTLPKPEDCNLDGSDERLRLVAQMREQGFVFALIDQRIFAELHPALHGWRELFQTHGFVALSPRP